MNLNGKLYQPESPILLAGNRAFCYGDALFETMRMVGGEIPLLQLHVQRLAMGMRYLGYEGGIGHSFLLKEIKKLVGKQQNARIRLEVFRKEGGLYTPRNNKFDFLLSCAELDENEFNLNKKGLIIGCYQEEYLPCTPLSNLKTCNALPYVLAARFRQKMDWDDCLLFNDKGFVAEASSSNVFIVKNGTFSTASQDQGCVLGVMRSHVLFCLHKNNRTCSERPISLPDILAADEVFLTNAIQGIRWVEKLADATYGNREVKALQLHLNQFDIKS